MVTCENCKAWERQTGDKGRCKRQAPHAMLTQTQNPLSQQVTLAILTFWPETSKADSCFEGVQADVKLAN